MDINLKNTMVIGYKNHAERIIKILLKTIFFKNIFVYHPVLSKLENIKNLDKRICITNNFNDIEMCKSIFISSPSETHCDYFKKICKIFHNSKNMPYIYCEKPVAVSVEEIKWFNENKFFLNKKTFVGFNMIFSDFAKNVKYYIKNKKLGKPVYASFEISHGLAFKENIKNNWRFSNSNIFSNIVGNLGIHYIHLCNDLFGKFSVSNVLSHKVKRFNNVDTTLIQLKSLNGVLSSIFLSYSTIYTNRYELFFTNGSVKFLDGLLLEVGPREYFNELGNYTSPPEKVISQNQKIQDNSLERCINFFIETFRKESFFKPDLFDQALNASETILLFKN